MDNNSKQQKLVNDPKYIGSPMKLFDNDLTGVDIEPVSDDEARCLIARAQNGDNESRNKLIMANIKLVRYWVSRKRASLGDNVAEEDLFQNGVLGLMRAIDMYDLESEVQFSTYASTWICGHLKEQSTFTRGIMDVPKWLTYTSCNCIAAQEELTQLLGRAPSNEELGAHLGISQKKLKTVLEYNASKAQPLDEDADKGLRSVYSPSAEEEYLASETSREIHEAVNSLSSPIAREIIKMHFGFDPYPEAMSYADIARTFTKAGIKTAFGTEYSRSRIAALGARALEQLKKILKEEN